MWTCYTKLNTINCECKKYIINNPQVIVENQQKKKIHCNWWAFANYLSPEISTRFPWSYTTWLSQMVERKHMCNNWTCGSQTMYMN